MTAITQKTNGIKTTLSALATTDSFVGDGMVLTDFLNWDIANAALQQNDGKLVISGYSGSRFALARYNSDGSLDASFDSDGKVITNFGWSGGFYGGDVVQQSTGALVVAGTGYNNGNFNLVRYNSNGSLDKTFNKTGSVSTDFGGSDIATALLVQSDDKLVVAGNKTGLLLARYNNDGSLDSSFDTDGKVSLKTFNGYVDVAQAVLEQSDGKLVVAGYSRGTSDDALLVRFNKDGSLDSSFDADGSLLGFFPTFSHANAIVQQTDGKLVVAGHSNGDFALMRLNEDGSFDKTFNNGAVVLTDFNRTEDSIAAIALQSDGKLLVLGRSGADFALARYNSDGSLDKTFHDNGTLTTDFGGSDSAVAVLLQASDNRIVAIGSSDGNFAMARYNGDGSLDTLLNNPPTGSVTLDNLTPTQGQTLTVSNDLADLDGLGVISYQWRAGDLVLGSGSSYDLTANDVAKNISVIASYVDARGNLESVRSSSTDAVLPIGVSIEAIEDSSGNISTTGEDGSNATYQVSLTGQPSRDVLINFVSSNNAEGIISNPTLSFSVDNWNQAQTLVVQGINDYLNDGNVSYSVTASIQTTDVNYAALSIAPLSLINDDDGRDVPLKILGKLTASNDMEGKDGSDYMKGGNFSDFIKGGIGKDSLFGGLGDDVLSGGDDNDRLKGDNGNDSLDGGTGDDSLDGGVGDDSLTGDNGNDTLVGTSGNDTLTGGFGNDTYYIGYGATNSNTVIDNGSTTDVDTVIMPYQLKNYQIPTGIKNCSITAGLEGNVVGNDSDNKIVGNDGNNSIDGSRGNDILNGNAGTDNLLGGDGADTINGGEGIDTMTGGAGGDLYYVDDSSDVIIEDSTTSVVALKNSTVKSAISWGEDIILPDIASSNVTYNLAGGVENLTLTGTANINGTGNEVNNVLQGNSGVNILTGLSGNDTLDGGLGSDSLTGGTGNDTFRFSTTPSSTNIDRITDFANVIYDNDVIYLKRSVFTKLAASQPATPMQLNSALFKVGVAAGDSNDYVTYNSTTGDLFYDTNGNGAGSAVKIAILTGHPTLTVADIFIY